MSVCYDHYVEPQIRYFLILKHSLPESVELGGQPSHA